MFAVAQPRPPAPGARVFIQRENTLVSFPMLKCWFCVPSQKARAALVESRICEETRSKVKAVSDGGTPMAGFGVPGLGEEGHNKSAE